MASSPAVAARRVAVVGAGVVGAAVAHALAREGAQVLLVESGSIGGGVTKDAFAWVGLAASAPDAEQAALRRVASADLDRLGRELAHPFALRRSGALSWTSEHGDPAALLTVDPALRASVRTVDRAEIADREPGLVNPPHAAVLAEGDGSVDPVALTTALVLGAQHLGAVLSLATHVHEVVVVDGEVRGLRTSGGTVDVDTVVLAAGTGTTALARSVGVHVPIDTSPCILLRLAAPRPLLNGIVSGPDLELRHAGPTTLLAAEDYVDDSADHGPDALARHTLDTVRREIAGAEDVQLTGVAVGVRPIPRDRRPVVGSVDRAQGLYVVSAHAAVALAAGLGRLAAEEILHGQESELLSPFRPGRFAPP